jgi:hypothetical protein
VRMGNVGVRHVEIGELKRQVCQAGMRDWWEELWQTLLLVVTVVSLFWSGPKTDL